MSYYVLSIIKGLYDLYFNPLGISICIITLIVGISICKFSNIKVHTFMLLISIGLTLLGAYGNSIVLLLIFGLVSVILSIIEIIYFIMLLIKNKK